MNEENDEQLPIRRQKEAKTNLTKGKDIKQYSEASY